MPRWHQCRIQTPQNPSLFSREKNTTLGKLVGEYCNRFLSFELPCLLGRYSIYVIITNYFLFLWEHIDFAMMRLLYAICFKLFRGFWSMWATKRYNSASNETDVLQPFLSCLCPTFFWLKSNLNVSHRSQQELKDVSIWTCLTKCLKASCCCTTAILLFFISIFVLTFKYRTLSICDLPERCTFS